MALTPSNLQSVSGVGDPISVLENNFGILNRDLYKVTPTYVNGVATTVIGPPTSGTHVTDEIWTDAWGGEWHCTAGGTPGTWRQHRFAIRSGEPGSGTIPNGYVIRDANDQFRVKIHSGSYVWVADSISADTANGRTACRITKGCRFSGSQFAIGTSGLSLGTADFSFILTFTFGSSLATRQIFATHSSGNNRVTLEISSSGTSFRLNFVDSGGSVTTYTLTPDIALVSGDLYQVLISVDRSGLATLYVNSVSDRDYSGSGVTVDVSGSSAVNIGNSNSNPWQLQGASITLTWYALAVLVSDVASLSEVRKFLHGHIPSPYSPTLNLDFDNCDPAQSLDIRDRSSSGNHGTISGSPVQVNPVLQANARRLTVGAATVLSKLMSATATLDFGSIAAAASADLTITVTGAVVGDSVALGLPSSPDAGIVFFGFVSAANTVTVRAMNITGSPVDPASGTYRATVFQFA